MSNENEIGRVVAVDTAQVTIELNHDLKALTRSTYEGTIEVGRINSYVIIPVGSRRIVAMITRVNLTEETEMQADKMMVSLPSTKRLMRATMIGSIDDRKFRQGISLFPVLDSKVYLTTKSDLDAIFSMADTETVDPEKPGYCIPIGKSVVFPDYDINIDPDAFFGKHAAIIGSTGSGKSCSIATIIQSILSISAIKRTRIIILDTNGEYRAAFQKSENNAYVDAVQNCKALYIPTDSSDNERLTIPYWFMNSEDFIRLFRAAPGVQRPVLLNAISLARQEGVGPKWFFLREILLQECYKILGNITAGDWTNKNAISSICDGLCSGLIDESNKSALEELIEKYPDLKKPNPVDIFREVKANAGPKVVKATAGQKEEKDYNPISMLNRQRSEDLINKLIRILASVSLDELRLGSGSADRPSFFSKNQFRYRHLETAMSRDQSISSRTRENCSTMLTRIYRLFEDSRYEFLFSPCEKEWPHVANSLASFIRDILGLESSSNANLSESTILPDGSLPFYDRQRKIAEASNVVIIDLSLLASEVLENVTALIGRLIHEFLQRLSDPVSGIKRGAFPVVLVLEEAQNYIHESRKTEDESISKIVFERIAREGRKYGLGLVVASQRPSELSKTVLSQCNSFIVHRLQNPEDLKYFQEIVPGIYKQLLDQLPALASRNALVLGECVQAPVLVEMREADPQPQSKNPQFYKSWTCDVNMPDVEAVCSKWEGIDINGVAEKTEDDDNNP